MGNVCFEYFQESIHGHSELPDVPSTSVNCRNLENV